MTDTPPALLTVLRDEVASRALVGITIDYLFELPLNRYLDLELLHNTVREAYQPEALKTLLIRVLPQGIEHGRELSEQQLSSLGTWLTPELDTELRAFVIQARPLKAERVQRWAHHPITRHITRAFVEETLERFIQRVKPGGEGRGVIGAASRGALGWAQKASRGVLGSVADQLQGQLKSLTSDFISASMSTLLDQLALIINTPEVAQLLADAQLKGYVNLISRPLSELIGVIRQEAPAFEESQVSEWSELVAEWVEHLLSRPEITEWVTRIQQQLISDLGDKSIKDLVGGDESTQTLRQALIDTLSPHLTSISETQELQDWCQLYLKV